MWQWHAFQYSTLTIVPLDLGPFDPIFPAPRRPGHSKMASICRSDLAIDTDGHRPHRSSFFRHRWCTCLRVQQDVVVVVVV